MADFIDYMDSWIKIFTPEGSAFPRFGSIYFIIIFLIIYSISYASTSFIPMFKNDEKKNFDNIRLLISLSMAFLGSTASFMFIVGWIQFIGNVLIIGFLVSLAILAIFPKQVRAKLGVVAGIIGAIVGLLLTINISGKFNLTEIFNYILNWFTSNWEWSIFIAGILLAIIVPILRALKKPTETE